DTSMRPSAVPAGIGLVVSKWTVTATGFTFGAGSALPGPESGPVSVMSGLAQTGTPGVSFSPDSVTPTLSQFANPVSGMAASHGLTGAIDAQRGDLGGAVDAVGRQHRGRHAVEKVVRLHALELLVGRRAGPRDLHRPGLGA